MRPTGRRWSSPIPPSRTSIADFSGDWTDGHRSYSKRRDLLLAQHGLTGASAAASRWATRPWLDAPDLFDPKRIRLVDIDGSGTTDLIYLGRDQVVLHFNQAGNAWSAPQPLTELAAPDNLTTVDHGRTLRGKRNGLSRGVFNRLPGETGRQLRYVELMGGQKPYLLIAAKNNLGAETRVSYAPSTQFYLQDRLAGHSVDHQAAVSRARGRERGGL